MLTTELYLDCNASLPCPPRVQKALLAHAATGGANPSSPHPPGRAAADLLRSARRSLAASFGVEAQRLIFTSSGTEANLLALTGLAPEGSSILLSAIEHPSVLAARRLLQRLGHRVEIMGCNPSGVVEVGSVLTALRPDTGLVALMAANNETGVLQPVAELALELQRREIALHVDAVQCLGKRPLQLGDGVRSVALSGHKVGAPPGIGALMLAEQARLRPLLGGSQQERGQRAGTENLPGILGWEAAMSELPPRWSAEARDLFECELLEGPGALRILGAPADRLPNTSLVSFEGEDARPLMERLGRRGVHVSTGAACRAGSPEPSHVLRAMGLGAGEARSALRFSFPPAAPAEMGRQAAQRVLEARAGRGVRDPHRA